MSRSRVSEEELQARLNDALALDDPVARRRAANKARRAIAQLQYRSTLGSGERNRIRAR